VELRNTNFYDVAGILIPGTVILYFLARQQRELDLLLNNGAVTVGGAAIFLALAYATGQLIAAVSSIVEPVLWLGKGSPTSWPRSGPSQVLSESQIERVQQRLNDHTGRSVTIIGMSRDEWEAHYSEVYRLVMLGHAGRTLMFNAIYGMSRGLAFTFLLLGISSALLPNYGISYASGMFAAAIIFGFRARRFGVNLVREVLVNFLVMKHELFARPPRQIAPSRKAPSAGRTKQSS
jgi:hypothetical protein